MLGAPVLGVAGLNTQNNTFLKICPIIAASSRAAPASGGGREQRPYGHQCASAHG
jgi:hypothetical protein